MIKKIIFIGMLCITSLSNAGENNAIKSCYSSKIKNPALVPETELFVVIDQTTPFDVNLKQLIANNIKPFLKPNNAFSVIQFSAYMQGHYTDVLVSGTLDAMISEDARNDVSKPALKKLDACMVYQSKLAPYLIGKALKTAFNSSNEISKSDIFSSLKDISAKVRASKAKRKVVLIASDMLENSSVTSFYFKRTVRKIDPKKELDIITEHQLLGDFGEAMVYVIGAGLISEDAKNVNVSYRSPLVMQTLSGFWELYFKQSNAKLIEFGKPALLNPIN